MTAWTRPLGLALWILGACTFDRPPDIGDDDGGQPDSAAGDTDATPSDVDISLSAPLTWTFNPEETSYALDASYLIQQTAVTVTAETATSITVNGTMTLDSDVPSAPLYLAPGVTTVEIQVVAPAFQRTYTIDIDRGAVPPSQLAYVKPSNTNAADNFGFSVAVDGDTMVVGAYSEDSSATGVNGDESSNSRSGSGAAYVFRRTGDLWVQEAYLKASNAGVDDHFGTDVAISGDLIAVGADTEDSNAFGVNGDQANDGAANAGAVYLFRRTGSTWSQEAYLKASNTGAGDRFGWQVAASGDTVAVGAWGEASAATGINGTQADNSAALAGAAYVFRRSGTTWSQEAYVKASNTEAGDNFGWALALSGDNLVVGAYGEDSDTNATLNPLSGAGAAYAFRRSGSTWTQVNMLKAPTKDAGDNFGWSVDVSDDRIVVGAPSEDSAAIGVDGNQDDDSLGGSGAAYVFTWSGSSWFFQSYLKASNTGGGNSFGVTVAVDGTTVLVGAMFEESNATGVNGNPDNDAAPGSGAAYVYRASGATWIPFGYVKASNTGSDDLFGWSVAASADAIVVGSRDEDSAATGIDGDGSSEAASEAGAVYVFR